MTDARESVHRLRIKLDDDLRGLGALSLPDRLPLKDMAGAKQVVLSLGNVRHLDQAGAAMLVRLYSQLRVRGSELLLADVPLNVRKTLRQVGLSELVPCVGSVPRERKLTPEIAVPAAQPET
jgi:ABC-type transporter Mla MlaB component